MITKKEFLSQYGDVYLVFSHYYKYSFTFTGTVGDGDIIEVSVGGDADNIYRLDVTADTPMKVSELDPSSGQVSRMGTTVAEFYDY
jgi:hypothetical protein